MFSEFAFFVETNLRKIFRKALTLT